MNAFNYRAIYCRVVWHKAAQGVEEHVLHAIVRGRSKIAPNKSEISSIFRPVSKPEKKRNR